MKDKYRVSLTAVANVSSGVDVRADDPEEAKKRACEIAEEGNVVWEYEGLIDDPNFTIEADYVTKL